MQNNTVTIQTALKQAEKKLSHLSNTPHLEAELLLAKILHVDKSYLFAWPERALTHEELKQLEALVERRQSAEPMAYILGHREFWSLDLLVTSDTLVPRPETELLVELTLRYLPEKKHCIVADIGTGCGAIAVALAHERPQWSIIATDQSSAALEVAKQNAKKFAGKSIQFYQGNWCDALPESMKFDAIVTNPPYLAVHDPHLAKADPCELRFEPRQALVAGEDALADIKIIIPQAKKYLAKGAYLLLEHGPKQGELIVELMKQSAYEEVRDFSDLAGVDRVTIGKH